MFTQSNIGPDVEKSQDNSPEPPTAEDISIDLRERAKGGARRFTSSDVWWSFAADLAEIRAKEFYRKWDFPSFTNYVETDLDLTKSVASDLVLAFKYVVAYHPECFAENRSTVEPLPSYSSLAMLARKRPQLHEQTAQALDTSLFSHTLTRKTLKEAIQKALAQQRNPEPVATAEDHSLAPAQARGKRQELLKTLRAFFHTVDLPTLYAKVTTVFDGWGDAPLADRRQLFGSLLQLIDQLDEIKATMQARTRRPHADAAHRSADSHIGLPAL